MIWRWRYSIWDKSSIQDLGSETRVTITALQSYTVADAHNRLTTVNILADIPSTENHAQCLSIRDSAYTSDSVIVVLWLPLQESLLCMLGTLANQSTI